MTLRRVRLADVADVVVLRGILMGYDGLAGAHGDRVGDVVALAVPDALVPEVDELLAALSEELSMTVLP